MTDFAEDYFEKIVSIHFPGGFYILTQIVIGVNNDFPNPKITVTPLAKDATVVFRRDQKITTPGNQPPFWAVYLPIQNMPIPGPPIDYFIPCLGHFTYHNDGGVQQIGEPSIDFASNNPNDPNGIPGSFWLRHKNSIYSSVTPEFAHEPGFGGFNIGKPLDATTAAAFAGALSSQEGNGWDNSPATWDFLHLNGPLDFCGYITSPPGRFSWNPSWVADVVHPSPSPTTIYENVTMIKVKKGSPEPAVRVQLQGGSGWNTNAFVYKTAKHKVNPGNVSGNGRVYFPITPQNDPVDSNTLGNADIDTGLIVDSHGFLTTS